MDGIPEPRVLTLDKNDENLILRIPDESEIANQEKQHLLQLQQQQQQESAGTKKEKVGLEPATTRSIGSWKFSKREK